MVTTMAAEAIVEKLQAANPMLKYEINCRGHICVNGIAVGSDEYNHMKWAVNCPAMIEKYWPCMADMFIRCTEEMVTKKVVVLKARELLAKKVREWKQRPSVQAIQY